MKTTIDPPEQLMTEVKTLAARERRQLSELIAELVRAGIDSRAHPPDQAEQRARAIKWLEEWIKLGDEALRDAPPGPTGTEILEADRNRLERSQ
jgi:hypothetical protein